MTLLGCPQPLALAYDTALLDLDGVVYRGGRAVAGATAALEGARAAGMRLAFVTNNAARTPAVVATALGDLGVVAAASDVVTSAQAAAAVMATLVAPGSAVLVVGGEGLRAALTEVGLRGVGSADEDPAGVVQGFSPEVGWAALAEGALAVRRGVPWVASNLDRTIPTERGIAPGNGTLVDAVAAAAGRRPDAVAGKPEPPLHREAVRRSGARRPLVVGDRLDTDIAGARREGSHSLLVLTGVAGPLDLLGAGPDQRPSYVGADLGALLAPHPAPWAVEGGFACGGWRASVATGSVRLEGSGTAMDALRATCAAVWSAPGTVGGLAELRLPES